MSELEKENNKKEPILISTIEEDGTIENHVNLPILLDHAKRVQNAYDKNTDDYFCFVLRTLINSFSFVYNKATGIPQEQFKAKILEVLPVMLSHREDLKNKQSIKEL